MDNQKNEKETNVEKFSRLFYHVVSHVMFSLKETKLFQRKALLKNVKF